MCRITLKSSKFNERGCDYFLDYVSTKLHFTLKEVAFWKDLEVKHRYPKLTTINCSKPSSNQVHIPPAVRFKSPALFFPTQCADVLSYGAHNKQRLFP